MIKRTLAAAAAVLLAASFAIAAPVKAKVTGVEGKKVTITLVDAKADWMKKSATVKWKGGVGRILEVKDDALVVSSKNAKDTKVGDELALEKGPSDLSGC